MEKKIKFAPTVMLIDACYLNRVVNDMRRHFSPIVGRELPRADLTVLLECMALDAGVQTGDNEIQSIFIYESGMGEMDGCTPSDLDKELNNVAFKGELGEVALYAYQPSEMATHEELFLESLQLLNESKEAVRLIVVPDEEGYVEKVYKKVADMKGKEITVLGMNPPQKDCACRFEMLGFAVLQALGIRGEELAIGS